MTASQCFREAFFEVYESKVKAKMVLDFPSVATLQESIERSLSNFASNMMLTQKPKIN